MTYTDERCPTCGAIPNWHLVYRRELGRQLDEARATGKPEPKSDVAIWRNIYKHEPNRPCRRFNEAYGFAPLSLAPPDGRFTRAGQDRIRRGLPPDEPVIEQGDAWEAA